MRRYFQMAAVMALIVGGVELVHVPKAYADGCQSQGASCNPGAALNCCNGLWCKDGSGNIITGNQQGNCSE